MANRRRAVVVTGVRTPFVRAFREHLSLDAIALGTAAVAGLLDRSRVPGEQVDALVWGGVVLPGASPNVGREIVLDVGLPHSVEAMTVTRACASGLQAVTLAAAAIERGDADVVIAGGSDSTSNAEVKLPQKVVHAAAPVMLGGKGGVGVYFKMLADLMPPWSVLPKMPKIAERTTGEVMGEACERMVRHWGVSREAQDAFAVASHHRAAKAWEAGYFEEEVVALAGVERDTIVRPDTSAEKLARLRPVFAADGSLTAGNSSTLTDGAAAVLLMEEARARALGFTPKAALKSWSYVGVDPGDQLLIGPAIAMPRALERAGLALADVELVDLHEAFAGQVLCVLRALASDEWAAERLGRDEAVGQVDPARLNVYGGSVALGHPFGATGARMVTTMANELHRSGARHALLGLCAAGGLGAAAVLERVE